MILLAQDKHNLESFVPSEFMRCPSAGWLMPISQRLERGAVRRSPDAPFSLAGFSCGLSREVPGRGGQETGTDPTEELSGPFPGS